MNDEKYSLFAIDGDITDWANDPTVPYLKFTDLSWNEASEICRFSFREGYSCVLWSVSEKDKAGGDDGTPKTC